MLFPPHVQKFISGYRIFGVLPLDKTLHFVIGMGLTILLKKLGMRLRYVFLTVLVIEILKEISDKDVIGNTPEEHAWDILATMLYPLLLIAVWVVKKWLRKRARLP